MNEVWKNIKRKEEEALFINYLINCAHYHQHQNHSSGSLTISILVAKLIVSSTSSRDFWPMWGAKAAAMDAEAMILGRWIPKLWSIYKIENIEDRQR